MKKKILKIITTISIVTICFILSFIIGVQVLNIFENRKIEKVADVQNNDIEENIVSTNEIDSIEGVIINNNNKTNKVNSFEGKIVSIEGTHITVENPSHLVDYTVYESDLEWHHAHKVIIDGKIYLTAGYVLYLDNVQIKDFDGNKINSSDLKIGDTINVTTKNVEYTINTIFTPIKSDNIKLIERKK